MRKRSFLYTWIRINSSVPKKILHSCVGLSVNSGQQVGREKKTIQFMLANISLSSVSLVVARQFHIHNKDVGKSCLTT